MDPTKLPFSRKYLARPWLCESFEPRVSTDTLHEVPLLSQKFAFIETSFACFHRLLWNRDTLSQINGRFAPSLILRPRNICRLQVLDACNTAQILLLTCFYVFVDKTPIANSKPFLSIVSFSKTRRLDKHYGYGRRSARRACGSHYLANECEGSRIFLYHRRLVQRLWICVPIFSRKSIWPFTDFDQGAPLI